MQQQNKRKTWSNIEFIHGECGPFGPDINRSDHLNEKRQLPHVRIRFMFKTNRAT